MPFVGILETLLRLASVDLTKYLGLVVNSWNQDVELRSSIVSKYIVVPIMCVMLSGFCVGLGVAEESVADKHSELKLDWVNDFKRAALQGDCSKILGLLARENKPISDPRMRDGFHWLKYSKSQDDCTSETYQNLIDLGADPNRILDDGISAISRAIVHTNIDLAFFLLRYGVSIDGPHDPDGLHCDVCTATPTSIYTEDENEMRCLFVNEWFDRGGSFNGQLRYSKMISLGLGRSCDEISPATIAALDETALSYIHRVAVRADNVPLLNWFEEFKNSKPE